MALPGVELKSPISIAQEGCPAVCCMICTASSITRTCAACNENHKIIYAHCTSKPNADDHRGYLRRLSLSCSA